MNCRLKKTTGCPCEVINVKAAGLDVEAGLPVGGWKADLCFETPEGSDYNALRGWVRFEKLAFVPGKGWVGGNLVVGDAVSWGVEHAGGLDITVSFGAGHSWIKQHYFTKCD